MKFLKTIAHLCLATLMLVSSTSFTVGMHFCGKELQRLAVFSKAAGCELEKQASPCTTEAVPGCCDNETIIHDAEDATASVTQIPVPAVAQADVEQPPVFISEIIPSSPFSQTALIDYDAPLPSPDLTISLQVFLI